MKLIGAINRKYKNTVIMVTHNEAIKNMADLQKPIHYAYAWQYKNSPEDEKEEKKFADDFLKAVLTQTVTVENELTDYLPACAN